MAEYDFYTRFKDYQSPIVTFTEEVSTKIAEEFDRHIFKAVLNTGVTVDRDELIKALRYDRGQYEKGFHDGFSSAKVRGEWVGVADDYVEEVFNIWSCSCCGKYYSEWQDKPSWNFCPNCGADMRGDGDDNKQA